MLLLDTARLGASREPGFILSGCVWLSQQINRPRRYLFEREGATLFVLATGGQPPWSSINSGSSTSQPVCVWIVVCAGRCNAFVYMWDGGDYKAVWRGAAVQSQWSGVIKSVGHSSGLVRLCRGLFRIDKERVPRRVCQHSTAAWCRGEAAKVAPSYEKVEDHALGKHEAFSLRIQSSLGSLTVGGKKKTADKIAGRVWRTPRGSRCKEG